MLSHATNQSLASTPRPSGFKVTPTTLALPTIQRPYFNAMDGATLSLAGLEDIYFADNTNAEQLSDDNKAVLTAWLSLAGQLGWINTDNKQGLSSERGTNCISNSLSEINQHLSVHVNSIEQSYRAAFRRCLPAYCLSQYDENCVWASDGFIPSLTLAFDDHSNMSAYGEHGDTIMLRLERTGVLQLLAINGLANIPVDSHILLSVVQHLCHHAGCTSPLEWPDTLFNWFDCEIAELLEPQQIKMLIDLDRQGTLEAQWGTPAFIKAIGSDTYENICEIELYDDSEPLEALSAWLKRRYPLSLIDKEQLNKVTPFLKRHFKRCSHLHRWFNTLIQSLESDQSLSVLEAASDCYLHGSAMVLCEEQINEDALQSQNEELMNGDSSTVELPISLNAFAYINNLLCSLYALISLSAISDYHNKTRD